MRILVTGHQGYIGAVLCAMLEAEGHEIVGVDTGYFAGCDFGPAPAGIPERGRDIRQAGDVSFEGIDAVVHLAALSNDPLGDLSPSLTYDINYRASVSLAELAKAAGVERFVFSSSCSNYGAAGEDLLGEDAPFNPVTPYGESKVLAEKDIGALASDAFSPVFLRNATAYGISPRLRLDLVVNNLVGYALTTGQVLLKSDGSAWRPLVHVEDICRAVVAVLDAPREKIHNQAFNVGSSKENYRIRDVAEIVRAAIPGTRVAFAEGASPDARNYRVDCSKITEVLEGFEPKWSLEDGVRQVRRAYEEVPLDREGFNGPRFYRLRWIKELLDGGRLDEKLRWKE